jgi:glycerol-3-phosphate O-acyltransferase
MYINNSLVHTDINDFMSRLISIFFRRINFDAESLKTLQEFQGKGRPVYVTYQSSRTRLLLLLGLLRKYGSPLPSLALDFTPSVLQASAGIVSRISVFFQKSMGKVKFQTIPDDEYIMETLRGNKSVALSLLSRKLFIRRYIERKSDTLQYLVEAQMLTDEPMYIFPLILFWNQNPERTRTLLASSATHNRGFLSGFFTVLKSSTPGFMRLAMPINLKEEIEQSPSDDPKQIARNLRNKLLEIYSREKKSILGPVIKTQQEMMEKVLYHRSVLDDIKLLKEEEHQSEKKLRVKAYKFFKEIAADFSIVTIKWFNAAVVVMFKKIFDGIYYNIDDLKRVREAAQRGSLILVPCHKSHIDYLIISSIFYQNKIIPPHIVAGANMFFFPMGPIFRRSGAFSMRRSFRGLKLYPTIFKQYIKTLINEGYSIEFFIEGTRARSGKLGSPKMGILKYLVNAIEEGYNKDLIFIPITINYDRILEESSYHMELKGKEKQAESTSTFVKSRKLLKRKYGKVYLSFNKPVSFMEYRNTVAAGEDVTSSIAVHIIRRISEIIMATPFSVTSAAMLLSSAKGFNRDALKTRFAVLHDYLRFAGAPMSDTMQTADNYDAIIDYCIESYAQDDIVKEVSSGEEGEISLKGVYTINENERARINFYKNSIAHYFLPATYIAIALLTLSKSDGTDMRSIVDSFKDLMDLLSDEFTYSEEMLNTEEIIAKYLDYLEKRSVITLSAGNVRINDAKRDELILYAKAVQDFLESYLIVFDCVTQIKKRMTRRELIFEVRKNGIKLYNLGEVRMSESLSMPTYENAIDKLEKSRVIEMVQRGKKHPDVNIMDPGSASAMKSRVEHYLRTLQKL